MTGSADIPANAATAPPAAPYAGRRVLVAGAGTSGAAAARALLDLGAGVAVTDQYEGPAVAELVAAGATFAGDLATPPDGVDLVVTSPGWRAEHPLLAAARERGIEVIGEVELAWRLRDLPAAGAGGGPAPWLAVTGTNGKTTTVTMLESILRAAGHRVVAAGNVGLPIVQAVVRKPAYDVLAVELSSFQLHWSPSVRPFAATVLNVADDHLDWHGSMQAYAADKARIYAGDGVRVFNADDAWSTRLAAETGTGRLVGCTLGDPAPGALGVRDGVLLDRAFGGTDTPLLRVDEIRPSGPHNVANALAAAALARAYGVVPDAVRAGLTDYEPGPHRASVVSTVDGVTYVNDSKATNAHAALASLTSFDRIVWLAGGLLKGAGVEAMGELVRAVRGRLVGVVLYGADRAVIAEAMARHAPEVPRVEVARTDDEGVVNMGDVVRAGAELARAAGGRSTGAGVVVLLAPAAASMDMFTNYASRGDAFAAAARALGCT